MAQLVLGGIGAVAGFMIGGPAGAQAGFMVGSALGSALSPKPRQEGPRMTDLKVQNSTYGAPIPIPYGMNRMAGEVIWADKIIEHESTTEQGGKGGGVEMTTYSYTCSFAIGICEGPIDGIRRIWMDGKLVWSDISTPVWTATSFTIYKGTEDQMPDPTMEGIIGVGLTPAHRGMAYVVFQDLDLSKYGNRIPQLSFEIVKGNPKWESAPPDYLATLPSSIPGDGSHLARVDPNTGWIWVTESTGWGNEPYMVTVICDNPEVGVVAEFSLPRLESGAVMDIAVGGGMAYVLTAPWPVKVSVYASRLAWIQEFYAGEANEDGSVKTAPSVGEFDVWGREDLFEKKVYDPVADAFVHYDSGPAESPRVEYNGEYLAIKRRTFVGTPYLWELVYPEGPIDPISINWIDGKIWIGYSFSNTGFNGHFACFTSKRIFSEVVLDESIGYPRDLIGDKDWIGVSGTWGSADKYTVINANTMAFTYYAGFQFNATSTGVYGYDTKRQKFLAAYGSGGDVTLRTLDPATGEIVSQVLAPPEQDGDNPSGWANTVTYMPTVDRYIVGATDGGTTFAPGPTTIYIVDPDTLAVERYFTYETGDGTSILGTLLTPPLLAPKTTSGGKLYVISLDTDHVKRLYLGDMSGSMPLWSIVRDISERCGLGSGQIDVSELTDEVIGYCVSNSTNGRAAIEPLTIAFKFDAVDSDGKVKFVKRGKSPVLSIDSEKTLPDDKS